MPRKVRIHVIRDLSGWAPQRELPWDPDKEQLLQNFSRSLFDDDAGNIYLIAANDGQLLESWRRLTATTHVQRAREAIERLLVEELQELEGVHLRFFNLSRWDSAELFDLVLESFLGHKAWRECFSSPGGELEAFGPQCPIRRNYELLSNASVQQRLRDLIVLCGHNGYHIPIRQILLLFTNAVLGHPDAKDGLMTSNDVPGIVSAGTASKASIFNNLLGGNLSETRRRNEPVFDYFERFQIGYETSNRIDNILIFGDLDLTLKTQFEQLVENDTAYGADRRYATARDAYVEGPDDDDDGLPTDFLDQLIAQRRRLFFTIPEALQEELRLWELTVFKYAGEYLTQVHGKLANNQTVSRKILLRLVRGLNRVFTGMLVDSDRELLLATSSNYSQAKISRILIDKVQVDPRKGERVCIEREASSNRVRLCVYTSADAMEYLYLNLVRFEFLSRVAEDGALPASFSKECYEDILSFKSRLLTLYSPQQDPAGEGEENRSIRFRILSLSDQGVPEDRSVEVLP